MVRATVRRRKRSEASLESAVAAFGRHGYYGTSMRQIADTITLTKGSLYYYFGSKADILFAAHDRALDRMLEVLERVLAAGGDPKSQLHEIVVEHTRAMVDGFHGTALGLELDALPPEPRRRLVAKRDRYERGVRALVAKESRRGAESTVATRAFLGALNWTAHWYRPDGPYSPQRIAELVADYAVAGLIHASTRAHHPDRQRRADRGRVRSLQDAPRGAA